MVGAQDVPGSFFPRRVAVLLEVDTTPTHTRPRTSSWAHTHTPLLTTRPQLSCHCSSPSPNATTNKEDFALQKTLHLCQFHVHDTHTHTHVQTGSIFKSIIVKMCVLKCLFSTLNDKTKCRFEDMFPWLLRIQFAISAQTYVMTQSTFPVVPMATIEMTKCSSLTTTNIGFVFEARSASSN